MSEPAPTIVWSREDEDGALVELLVVGPGPPTLPGSVWPGTLGHSPREPGAWAVVNHPALGPLPDDLAAEVRAAADPEPLRERCRAAALAIVAARLHEDTVREEPFSSGVLLARLRPEGDGAVLELAPALVRGGAPVTSLPVRRVRAGGEETPLRNQAKAVEVDVDLGTGEPARLPAAALTLPPAATAELDVTLPDRDEPFRMRVRA